MIKKILIYLVFCSVLCIALFVGFIGGISIYKELISNSIYSWGVILGIMQLSTSTLLFISVISKYIMYINFDQWNQQ